MQIIANVVLSSSIIAIVLWISRTNPTLGGFILSLPISTLIVLAFSKLQSGDTENTVALAKSIFVGVPLGLIFFVPFLFADRLKLSFWTAYATGFGLLSVAFFTHRWVMSHWLR